MNLGKHASLRKITHSYEQKAVTYNPSQIFFIDGSKAENSCECSVINDSNIYCISIFLPYLFSVITTELYAILSACKITAHNELHYILVLMNFIQAIQNLNIYRRSITSTRQAYFLLYQEKLSKIRHLLDSQTLSPCQFIQADVVAEATSSKSPKISLYTSAYGYTSIIYIYTEWFRHWRPQYSTLFTGIFKQTLTRYDPLQLLTRYEASII